MQHLEKDMCNGNSRQCQGISISSPIQNLPLVNLFLEVVALSPQKQPSVRVIQIVSSKSKQMSSSDHYGQRENTVKS